MAAFLHRGGNSVILCGRTARAGIKVRPDGGEPMIVPGPIQTDAAAIGAPVDLVVLAVKATQVAGARDWLAALCDERTVVGIFQNGVEQRALVSPYSPTARLVPVVVRCPAETQPEGWVRLRGRPNLTLPAGRDAEVLAAPLRSAGCEIVVAQDFETEAWRKLLVNALGGLMALAGRRFGMFRRDDIDVLARQYLLECLTVAKAEKARLDEEAVDAILAQCREYPEDMSTSMLADRQANRALEWDIRNGVILRKARVHGLPAPISDVIVPLLAAASDGPG
jgi:2-dehydropantoate 2-reductase